MNTDDCIRKMYLKIYQSKIRFYSKIDLKLIKKQIFSCEKMRNSGNYIYDYAHSFFGEDC